MSTPDKTLTRIERKARLEWVTINRMKVSPLAQRDLNPARVNRIITRFDLEQVGTPTVNERDGWFYLIDGQHRIEALRGLGYGDQQIECWTYLGLSEAEEAEKFLKLNDTLAVNAFAKFKVGVQAGRELECDIDRIVRDAGFRVALAARDRGAISAVGTLGRVYQQTGGDNLARTLDIIRESYGDLGLSSAVIDGISLMLHRYGDQLDNATVITRLTAVHGGLGALLARTENWRQKMRAQKRHCVAAAAVEIINGGKGGRKLQSWWRDNHDYRDRNLTAIAS